LKKYDKKDICINKSNDQLVTYLDLKKPWYLHERELD